jgi:hypothetical protein
MAEKVVIRAIHKGKKLLKNMKFKPFGLKFSMNRVGGYKLIKRILSPPGVGLDRKKFKPKLWWINRYTITSLSKGVDKGKLARVVSKGGSLNRLYYPRRLFDLFFPQERVSRARKFVKIGGGLKIINILKRLKFFKVPYRKSCHKCQPHKIWLAKKLGKYTFRRSRNARHNPFYYLTRYFEFWALHDWELYLTVNYRFLTIRTEARRDPNWYKYTHVQLTTLNYKRGTYISAPVLFRNFKWRLVRKMISGAKRAKFTHASSLGGKKLTLIKGLLLQKLYSIDFTSL